MLLLSMSSLRGVFGGHDERVWLPTVEQMINTVPRNPYNLFYARMITMLLKYKMNIIMKRNTSSNLFCKGD